MHMHRMHRNRCGNNFRSQGLMAIHGGRLILEFLILSNPHNHRRYHRNLIPRTRNIGKSIRGVASRVGKEWHRTIPHTKRIPRRHLPSLEALVPHRMH